jgi:hypothetical protein
MQVSVGEGERGVAAAVAVMGGGGELCAVAEWLPRRACQRVAGEGGADILGKGPEEDGFEQDYHCWVGRGPSSWRTGWRWCLLICTWLHHNVLTFCLKKFCSSESIQLCVRSDSALLQIKDIFGVSISVFFSFCDDLSHNKYLRAVLL